MLQGALGPRQPLLSHEKGIKRGLLLGSGSHHDHMVLYEEEHMETKYYCRGMWGGISKQCVVGVL